jgi:hypothetical protein
VFRVTAVGAVQADKAYSSSGADYAEYFEWEDGNPAAEDRRGLSVSLSNNFIVLAANVSAGPDDIIGVVSAAPAVIGDSADMRWHAQYMLDEYGARIMNEARKYVTNPDYDATAEYVPRSQRKEWAAVGLVGKLRVRRGQPLGTRWRKLREFDTTDLYLVR